MVKGITEERLKEIISGAEKSSKISSTTAGREFFTTKVRILTRLLREMEELDNGNKGLPGQTGESILIIYRH